MINPTILAKQAISGLTGHESTIRDVYTSTRPMCAERLNSPDWNDRVRGEPLNWLMRERMLFDEWEIDIRRHMLRNFVAAFACAVSVITPALGSEPPRFLRTLGVEYCEVRFWQCGEASPHDAGFREQRTDIYTQSRPYQTAQGDQTIRARLVSRMANSTFSGSRARLCGDEMGRKHACHRANVEGWAVQRNHSPDHVGRRKKCHRNGKHKKPQREQPGQIGLGPQVTG